MNRHFFSFGIILFSLFFIGAGCITFGDGKSTTSGSAGMFASVDRGETWEQISSLSTNDGIRSVSAVSVHSLVQDPQDPATLYWASRQNGMFYTVNNGKTWQRPPAPLDKGFIYSIVVHPKEKCTLYSTNGRFVYKSLDCSRSWKEVYRHTESNGIIRSLAIDSFGDNDIFMALDSGQLFRSIDGGNSWQINEKFRLGLRRIISDSLQEGIFYVVSLNKGLQKSVDGGKTWKDISGGLAKFSGGLNFRYFFIHPFKLDNIFWISDYGILFSENGGATWEAMNLLTSPGSVKIYGFTINPKNDDEMYYTATIGTRSTLYSTVDGGLTWTTKKLPTGQVPTVLRVHPEQGNVLYAGFTIPPS